MSTTFQKEKVHKNLTGKLEPRNVASCLADADL